MLGLASRRKRGFRVWGLGFRVEGFRVEGLGVEGLGFRGTGFVSLWEALRVLSWVVF